MLPTRNRPNGSHLPSLNRLPEVLWVTRAISRSTAPCSSVTTTVSPRAATNPPEARGWKLASGGGSGTLDRMVPSASAVLRVPRVMSAHRSNCADGSQTMLSARTARASAKTVAGPVVTLVLIDPVYRGGGPCPLRRGDGGEAAAAAAAASSRGSATPHARFGP